MEGLEEKEEGEPRIRCDQSICQAGAQPAGGRNKGSSCFPTKRKIVKIRPCKEKR